MHSPKSPQAKMELAIHKNVNIPASQCGAHMKALGFGTWQAEPGKVGQAVKHALHCGYRLIDCATVYRNQKEIGVVLHEAIKSGAVARGDLYIVSKVWNTHHSPEAVMASTKKTLADLQLEYLDLLLVHWPVAHRMSDKGVEDESNEAMFPQNSSGQFDVVDIPIKDTWQAMERLVTKGIVKDIGLSNFTIKGIEEVASFASVPPAALQVELHPALPQPELVACARKHGMAIMAYCPLGIGFDDPKKGLLNHEQIKAIAKKANLLTKDGHPDTARLLLQWSCQMGFVCLSKSVTPERIEANAKTPFGGLSLEIMADLKDFGEHVHMRTCDPGFGPNGTSVFDK